MRLFLKIQYKEDYKIAIYWSHGGYLKLILTMATCSYCITILDLL
jgi:hypothetical protein